MTSHTGTHTHTHRNEEEGGQVRSLREKACIETDFGEKEIHKPSLSLRGERCSSLLSLPDSPLPPKKMERHSMLCCYGAWHGAAEQETSNQL